MPVTIRSSLLLLVLSILLPAAVGGVWYVTATFQAERRAHEQTLRDTSRALLMVLDGEIGKRAAMARVLALSRWLDDAPQLQPDHLARFTQLAQGALQGMDGWVELRGRDGLVWDLREVSSDPRSPAPVDGSELVTEAVVLPLRAASQPDRAHAAAVAPVVRDGQTVLNLLVTIRPGELQRIIDAQKLPAGWVSAVLDSRAMVMARQPDGPAFLGRSATQDLRERIAREREGLIESVSLDGKAVVGYFSTSEQGWTYITAMPRELFVGVPSRTVYQTAGGALLLLTLSLLAALWLSRRIVGPVRALKHVANQLQRGVLVPAPKTGIVECDEVALALSDAVKAVHGSRAELERQVAEAIERTRQAEQIASQSQRVEALGRLTGGVAHDFNNLLGVISNSAHLIERHPAAGELAVPLAATLRAVETGSQLTQHLLRFAGRRPVKPQPLQLARWLPELHDLLRSVLGRHVELAVHVAEGLPMVRVDASELELALVNLALNARDAMAHGGQLRLTARLADAEETQRLGGPPTGRHVLIAVTDNGAGIDPALLPRVFEPFFTTKELGRGTGLGLSQVHGFCVQAGGAARIDSTPGLGTTVSLLLPAFTDGEAPAVEAAPSALTTIAGARVLVVEDNPTLSDVTVALLRAHGAEVDQAAKVADALQKLAEEPAFDVVLSDVVMPGRMDGIGMARLLKQQRPQLPVVLISGFNQADNDGEFLILRKPCPQDELLAVLADAVAGRPGGGMRPALAASAASSGNP